jgi:ribosomal protein L17
MLENFEEFAIEELAIFEEHEHHRNAMLATLVQIDKILQLLSQQKTHATTASKEETQEVTSMLITAGGNDKKKSVDAVRHGTIKQKQMLSPKSE